MRKWLALAIQVPFIAMMYVACSGDNSTTADAGDSSVQDVKADKKPLPDVAAQDSGGQCVPTTTIDTSQIKWVPPNSPNSLACTDVQAQAYWDDCFGPNASNAKCTGFTGASANAVCLKCLISTANKDTTYGALIAVGGVDYANIAGCIAIVTGDLSSTGCGAKFQAAQECETLACSSNCPPVTDQTSFKEYTNCTTAADNAVCKSYLDGECNFADSGVDGSAAAAACANQSSFQNYYTLMAATFCGALPAPDGGTDGGASDGGSSDASSGDATADAPDGD